MDNVRERFESCQHPLLYLEQVAVRIQVNNWDFPLSKVTPLTERVILNFGAEFFNLFNRVQFGPPKTAVGGASFCKITSLVNNPRQIQFSLKSSF